MPQKRNAEELSPSQRRKATIALPTLTTGHTLHTGERTVNANVQPPYALYMWCMLAWKCRKSMTMGTAPMMRLSTALVSHVVLNEGTHRRHQQALNSYKKLSSPLRHRAVPP